MRILHYLKAIRLEDGGVVRAVLDLCTYQARAGHEVTLATCDDKDVPAPWKQGSPGCPKVALLPRPLRLIQIDGAFEKAAAEVVSRVDAIHLHVLWDPAQLPIVDAAVARKVPFVQSPHGMLADWSVIQKKLKKTIYYKAFARRLLDRAAFVCTTAQGELDQSQKRHPNTPGRVIPLVFDLEPYRVAPTPDAARKNLPLPSADVPSLLYLSRLHYKKRPDLLVAAARLVKDQGHKFNIVFAGPLDVEYRTGLMDFARSIGVDDITTVLGMVPAEFKPSLFSACDLFVLPTSMENFGFVYFEALACGTPVVTTKGTDTWRELEGSGGGRIVEMIKSEVKDGEVGGGDVAQLAATIGELISNRAALKPMGLAGRAWVCKHLEPAVVVAQYIALYEEAIKGSPLNAMADANPTSTDPRPLLALINNVQTPYRIHLHRRIVREIPAIRIASLFTHDQPDQPWEARRIEEINPVAFGLGQPVVEQSHPHWALADWRKGGRIIAWLKENKARAVILGGYSDTTRLRLIRWCRRAGVPCFVFADSNIHDDRATGLKRVFKNMFVRWVVRNVTGLMPCGSAGQRFFERYGAAPDRCYFVPYEPDYDQIRSLPEAAIAQARTDFGLPAERQRLVVCSRLIDRKRIDLAIDAFAAMAREHSEWDLVIIGSGPLRETLGERIPADLRARVIWTGFIGEQTRISAIYRASHVLVCPSDLEPWGVVINEAAAAGLAIVSSAVVGAAVELVEDGVNGYLFEPGNLSSLVGCLGKTLAHTERLRTGSPQVLARWRERGDPVAGIRNALSGAGIRIS